MTIKMTMPLNTTHNSRYARSLVEASLDPLITIRLDGKIMDMNEATVRMTGLTREQLTGTDFFEYFTEPLKAQEVYREIFSKGFVAGHPLTMRQGKLTDVLFNGSVYKDEAGEVLGAVVVARDISAQNKIEKDLTEAIIFAELAASIAEEAKAAAEEATRVAEEAVRAKQQFLSNMSHEIRTPMNAIIGFTKIVLRSVKEPKQKEYLNAIKVSGEALLVLINDILDLAKVDAGKMTFEQRHFDLYSSVSSMLQLFEGTIKEKNLSLVLDYDPGIPKILAGDPIRLRQIILNLVSNAVKFTEKGFVKVSVKPDPDRSDKTKIRFSVQDSGIGISGDTLPGIFESFQQASKGTARLYGGTGLGLAIVKKLIEAQGGNIQVESEPGTGSTFSFSLHFEKAGSVPPNEESLPAAEMNQGPVKVLVVEDIPLNQLLIKTLLDDLGFENECASNGKVAIDLLEASLSAGDQPFDIILMDLQMPVMDGFEATAYIRNTMRSTIPILALSADVTTVDVRKCREKGINEYITKPVDETELEQMIIKLVKKTPLKTTAQHIEDNIVDLGHLHNRTKGNAGLKAEIIRLYLEQTPGLVKQMTLSMETKDHHTLKSVIHKLIPSFTILGIKSNPETLARKILLSINTNEADQLAELVHQLQTICQKSCIALNEQLAIIQNTHERRT